MKKNCPHCKKNKEIKLFAWKNKLKGTRQPYCNVCRSKKAKISYEKHKTSVIQKAIKRNKKHLVAFKEYKKGLSCLLCGENEEACLDFHHKDPTTKKFVIGHQLNYGREKVRLEIEKCICLCSNCHRKVHKYGIEKVKRLLSSTDRTSDYESENTRSSRVEGTNCETQ